MFTANVAVVSVTFKANHLAKAKIDGTMKHIHPVDVKLQCLSE